MRRRLPFLLSFALLVALPAAALPSVAAAESAAGCAALPAAAAKSALHLPSAVTVRSTSSLDGGASPESIDNICQQGLWSGPKPTSKPAMYKRAREGRAALVGAETWAPGPGDEEGRWESKEFGKLLAELEASRFKLTTLGAGGGNAKPLNPTGEDGFSGTGITAKVVAGPGKGLISTAGCWWNASAYKAACVIVVEAKSRPGVADLNALAKKVVPAALG
ncbi:MAG TPA: hypothetical protein VHA76_07855 [Solirubrobacterales bacterium]|nr:hypothetical protein [Solirubrobacterales bacterium]